MKKFQFKSDEDRNVAMILIYTCSENFIRVEVFFDEIKRTEIIESPAYGVCESFLLCYKMKIKICSYTYQVVTKMLKCLIR